MQLAQMEGLEILLAVQFRLNKSPGAVRPESSGTVQLAYNQA